MTMLSSTMPPLLTLNMPASPVDLPTSSDVSPFGETHRLLGMATAKQALTDFFADAFWGLRSFFNTAAKIKTGGYLDQLAMNVIHNPLSRLILGHTSNTQITSETAQSYLALSGWAGIANSSFKLSGQAWSFVHSKQARNLVTTDPKLDEFQKSKLSLISKWRMIQYASAEFYKILLLPLPILIGIDQQEAALLTVVVAELSTLLYHASSLRIMNPVSAENLHTSAVEKTWKQIGALEQKVREAAKAVKTALVESTGFPHHQAMLTILNQLEPASTARDAEISENVTFREAITHAAFGLTPGFIARRLNKPTLPGNEAKKAIALFKKAFAETEKQTANIQDLDHRSQQAKRTFQTALESWMSAFESEDPQGAAIVRNAIAQSLQTLETANPSSQDLSNYVAETQRIDAEFNTLLQNLASKKAELRANQTDFSKEYDSLPSSLRRQARASSESALTDALAAKQSDIILTAARLAADSQVRINDSFTSPDVIVKQWQDEKVLESTGRLNLSVATSTRAQASMGLGRILLAVGGGYYAYHELNGHVGTLFDRANHFTFTQLPTALFDASASWLAGDSWSPSAWSEALSSSYQDHQLPVDPEILSHFVRAQSSVSGNIPLGDIAILALFALPFFVNLKSLSDIAKNITKSKKQGDKSDITFYRLNQLSVWLRTFGVGFQQMSPAKSVGWWLHGTGALFDFFSQTFHQRKSNMLYRWYVHKQAKPADVKK